VHWVIDKLHQKKHKDSCPYKEYTAKQLEALCDPEDLNTSIMESFNGWIRPFNVWLNYLNPPAHRFWVVKLLKYYNSERNSIKLRGGQRLAVAARAYEHRTTTVKQDPTNHGRGRPKGTTSTAKAKAKTQAKAKSAPMKKYAAAGWLSWLATVCK